MPLQSSMDLPSLDTEVVDRIIRVRRTSKLLHSSEQIDQLLAITDADASQWSQQYGEQLRTIVEGAAWAPFHKRAHEQTHRQGAMDSIIPWRCHVLETMAQRELLLFLQDKAQQHPDSKWSRAWQSKIKNMVAACGALVQLTWLPDPEPETGRESSSASGASSESSASLDELAPSFSENNIEHVAAAGAAAQNLLLAAEARGWRSYWSSGGILRDPEVFDYLGIGGEERLLGSLFISPVLAEGVTVKDGGLREQRGPLGSWARWVESESLKKRL